MTSRLPSTAVPTVSIIVVNYNGLRFLEKLLSSLQGAFARYSHETIVIDNASVDGSVEWLRRRRDVRLLALASNTGFTGGNNVGAEHALGRVLLLLNADTEVRGPLDALVDAALRPEVGAAGCQLRYGDGRLQHSVGLEHSVVRIALSWLGLEKRAGAPSLFRKVETAPGFYAIAHPRVAWVSGACLATRREVWRRLGGLDPAFFMYIEDVDYCHRVRDAGLAVSYVPEPVVTHHEAGGRAWVGTAALMRTARAYQIYTVKTRGPLSARALCSALAFIFALRGAAFAALRLIQGTAVKGPQSDGKAQGYLRAARSLLGAALTGRIQSCP